jgi:hypothetical protein
MSPRISGLNCGDAQTRLSALKRTGYECERCDYVGWSRARADAMVIRERYDTPDRPWVLCPACVVKHDARATKRRAG